VSESSKEEVRSVVETTQNPNRRKGSYSDRR
jgi:hypothetical protein